MLVRIRCYMITTFFNQKGPEMSEKRKFNRWGLEQESAFVDMRGEKKEVDIIDISIGGMRIETDSIIDEESELSGEFSVLPNIGPFFVKGKVVWVVKSNDRFESGVKFERVSTVPLEV